MNRITDILNDEESLRQLSELAEMLKTGDFGDVSAQPENCSEINGDFSGILDMNMMLKISSLAEAMNSNDKNTELLLALRPHLSQSSQQRLDRAVKLLKLISLYETAKDSGLLNNFL